jgi:hypothetical protein
MNNIKQQIAELQKERINEIISDPTIDKLEKLRILQKERLFQFDPYYSNPFKEYEKTLELSVHEKTGKTFSTVRNIITDTFERYRKVTFVDFLEDYFDDNYDEELVNDPTTLYPICESNDTDDKIFKTKDEIIDIIFDHCFENKIVGFTFDW